MNYLPAPNKPFPLGHLKPIQPPGCSQRKKTQPLQKKTLPFVLEDAEENDPIDVIETVPLPFKHKDNQFKTSTPNPSTENSSKGSDSSYQTAEKSLGPDLDKTQNLELTTTESPLQGCLSRSEQRSLDQEEINKQQGLDQPFNVSIEIHTNPDGSSPQRHENVTSLDESRASTQDKKDSIGSAETLEEGSATATITPQNASFEWDYSDVDLEASHDQTLQLNEPSILVSPKREIFSPNKEIPSQLMTSNIMDTTPPLDWDELVSFEDQSQNKDKKALNTKDLYKITADISESSDETLRHYAGEEDLDPTLPNEIQEEINQFNPRKASFADHQGLPLAIDNEGNRWLLTKDYEHNPNVKTRKHIPYSNSSSSNNEDELVTTLPETDIVQQPTTTRTGRVIKKPERLIEKETPPKEKRPKKTIQDTTFEKAKTGLSPTRLSRLTGFPWFKKTPEPKLVKKLSGIEHPNFTTPVYSRFNPSKLIKARTGVSKQTVTATPLPQTPTPQENVDKSVLPDLPTKAKPAKNPKISPLGPIGLLRMPVAPSPTQQQPQLPDNIQLGDSPPALRRSTRARKPPSRYGFED